VLAEFGQLNDPIPDTAPFRLPTKEEVAKAENGCVERFVLITVRFCWKQAM
jgi:hypothetical protein